MIPMIQKQVNQDKYHPDSICTIMIYSNRLRERLSRVGGAKAQVRLIGLIAEREQEGKGGGGRGPESDPSVIAMKKINRYFIQYYTTASLF